MSITNEEREAIRAKEYEKLFVPLNSADDDSSSEDYGF